MIDQQTIIFVIIGAVLAMLMIGGTIIGATYIIRPKMLLRKRMNQIGMIGDDGASDKAEGRRKRRIQEKVKQLKAKGGDKGFADRIADQLLQAGLNITVSAYFVISAVVGVVAVWDICFPGCRPSAPLRRCRSAPSCCRRWSSAASPRAVRKSSPPISPMPWT